MSQTEHLGLAVCMKNQYMRQIGDPRSAVCMKNQYICQTEDPRLDICIENSFTMQMEDFTYPVCMIKKLICILPGNLVIIIYRFPSNLSFTRKSRE
ncbi:hypothetical protein [Gracilibacillus halophilus]|uniref:hypothetical protein n=1 Tax=Gracilibacillus halophilus TaxID=470864 RepID=UPI0012EAA7A5|nr:hypothetical protein [Gracilibacillus halophilus]